jgi:hypothetical protein
MKNKTNKQNKIMLKNTFTKQELLTLKKYPRLLSYNIPYSVINRAYKKYIANIDDYIFINKYPKHWFSKDIVSFCNAVKMYIVSKQENHEYKFGTTGYTNIEKVIVSGLDKYLDKR